MGRAEVQMPGQSAHPKIANLRASSNLADLAGVGFLAPKFARRRSAPTNHQVITDEVDAEKYDRADGAKMRLQDLAS